MSTFDRAFIKAFDRTAETTEPQRRGSTRDVLLSISARRTEAGRTQRIEQPIGDAGAPLAGPHVDFPTPAEAAPEVVAPNPVGWESSSVIVGPMNDLSPEITTPSTPRPAPSHSIPEPPADAPPAERNQQPESSSASLRTNINLDHLRQIRELEAERAARGAARRGEAVTAQSPASEPTAPQHTGPQHTGPQHTGPQHTGHEQPAYGQAARDQAARDQAAFHAAYEQATYPATRYPATHHPPTLPSPTPDAAHPYAADSQTDDTAADEPQDAQTTVWEPAWEVDQMLWPEMTDHLLQARLDYFAEAGDQLRDSAADGLRVLAVSSEQPGEGRTTVTLCLARAAAAAGLRVAVLDADLAHPALAEQLNLTEAPGWDQATAGRVPLCESAVYSLEDNICIFPRSIDADASADVQDVATLIDSIAAQYDLVVVDSPALAGDAASPFDTGERCPVDAVVLVRDVRRTTEADIQHNVRLWKAIGVGAVGVVENFLDED